MQHKKDDTKGVLFLILNSLWTEYLMMIQLMIVLFEITLSGVGTGTGFIQ